MSINKCIQTSLSDSDSAAPLLGENAEDVSEIAQYTIQKTRKI